MKNIRKFRKIFESKYSRQGIGHAIKFLKHSFIISVIITFAGYCTYRSYFRAGSAPEELFHPDSGKI
jgi:hypothetical protein